MEPAPPPRAPAAGPGAHLAGSAPPGPAMGPAPATGGRLGSASRPRTSRGPPAAADSLREAPPAPTDARDARLPGRPAARSPQPGARSPQPAARSGRVLFAEELPALAPDGAFPHPDTLGMNYEEARSEREKHAADDSEGGILDMCCSERLPEMEKNETA